MWAAWTSWRGSPGLVRHVAETAIHAIGHEPQHVCISASVLDDSEEFTTPAAFIDNVTREALRDFDRLDIDVRNAWISVSLVFLRRGEDLSLPGPEGPRVQLTVRCTDPDRSGEATDVARSVCASLRRGHRRWLGRTSGSDDVPVSWRGPSLPRPTAVSFAARVVGGFAFAGLVLSTTWTLFPKLELPSWTTIVIACVAGLGSAFAIPALVPSIEIAEPGATRLLKTVRWIGVTLVGLVVAQLLKKAFGG